MPKTRRATSKRMTSSKRHKIERKKREHKRDLRRAAKVMKASGLGPKRSKKTREMAKLALKVSNAHPDKESILTRLLQTREAMKVQRATKRLQSEEEAFQAMAKERGDGDEAGSSGEDEEEAVDKSTTRSLLFIPNSKQNDFTAQFTTAVEKLVFPVKAESSEDVAVDVKLPNAAFVVTADARCAAQSLPWALLDSIIARGEEYAASTPAAKPQTQPAPRKRGRDAPEAATTSRPSHRRVLILIALTKCDLVSAPTIGTQFSLLADAITKRYHVPVAPAASSNNKGKKQQEASPAPQGDSIELPGGIVFAFTPVSTQFEKSTKHLLRILRQFLASQPKVGGASAVHSNISDKIIAMVVGFPNTGRRSLMRALQVTGTDSGVSVVPLRAAVVQLFPTATSEVTTKFVFPNAKEITLVGFPEDHRLRQHSDGTLGGDIVFKSFSFVEKMLEPEHVAVMVVNSVLDAVGLAQAFCQPAFRVGAPDGKKETEEEQLEREGRAASRFLQGIGHTVRREKGFHVCPLFVSSAGTAGRLAATSLSASTAFTSRQKSTSGTLIDATFSNATPNKLVRISSVVSASRGKSGKKNLAVKRADGHNALKLGARAFLREFCQSRNVPWAILRGPAPLTQPLVEAASCIFSIQIFSGVIAPPADAVPLLPSEHFATYLSKLTTLLKDYLILLPHNVVEFAPSAVVPAQHVVDAEESSSDDDDDEEDEDDDDEEGEWSEEGEDDDEDDE